MAGNELQGVCSGIFPAWVYYGLSRHDADILLTNKADGSFLVRGINNDIFILTVKCGENVKKYKIKKSVEGKFYIVPRLMFDSIDKLVAYYCTHDGMIVKPLFPVLKD